tara:strand:- start:3495 stop:4451 length:957 start_codon:yes stop_codon:yes gene_type:complete
MVKCKECGEKFKDDKSLHRHLRSHNMLMVDYYHKHFPRKDLYTGKLLKFKNKEHYFNNDFENKIHMKKWLQESPREETRKYCEALLMTRKLRKKLNYVPTEVELRSSMCPPITFLEEILEQGYYNYCLEKLELKSRHFKMPKNLSLANDPGSNSFNQMRFKIYVDTREQRPLKFKLPIEVKTLNFGDYAFSHEDYSANTYIERKSVTDFIGTMSGGLERFKKEIERAKQQNQSLIILVEESLTNCLSFNHLPYVSKKIRANPDFIFHNVKDLLQEYSHIQFLFVKGRVEASRVIEKLFVNGGIYKNYDLQLAYNLKEL